MFIYLELCHQNINFMLNKKVLRKIHARCDG